jgi:NADPH:quinone reductase-like Zn-dependent oxidoreductase
LTALQGVRDRGRVQPGQKVLINGAAGGVGTFAVQIAKSFGAHVTGVCTTASVAVVESIGADRVIDYTREDFTAGDARYDLIFDCAGNRRLSECVRVMTPKGIVLPSGMRPTGRWIDPLPQLLSVLISSWFVSQHVVLFVAKVLAGDLETLKELVESGKVTPVIDKRYTLSDAAEAMRYLKEGHTRGKVVITVP